MKPIEGFEERDRCGRSVFSHNGLSYEPIPEYGNFPDEFEFSMYSGGCCDKEDNLFMMCRDTGHPAVMLDARGNYAKSSGKGLFQEVHSLCVTEEDTLLCVDTGLHVVRELTKGDEWIGDLGNLGVPSDSDLEKDMWHRAQRKGKIVPTDVVFDKGWSSWAGVQTIRRAVPPLNRPTGVCMGPKGDILVSDGYGNAAVHRFSKDGTLLRTWGGPGDKPGRFYIPHSLWVDRLNRAWVGGWEANSVHVFDENSEVLAYMSENLYQPTGVWADDTYVYIAERGGDLIIADMDMEIAAQLGFYNSPIRAHGMCGNSEGELFLMPLPTCDHYFLMKLVPVKQELVLKILKFMFRKEE